MDTKKMMLVKYKKGSGFTLIELMVAIAVLAILITLVAPSFQEALERRRLERAGEDVIAAIRYARSEALKQGVPVRIVFKNAGSGSWCYGIDDEGDLACDCSSNDAATACEVSGEEKVLRNNLLGSSKPFPTIDYKTGAGFSVINNDDIIFEQTRGFVTAGDFPAGASTLRIHLQSGNNAMCIDINRIGRIKMMSDLIGYANDGSCERK